MLLEELTEYKKKLAELFNKSDEIKKLLIIDDKNNNLMYKQIYPYAYVPDIQTKANIYLCFDVEVPRTSPISNIIKDVSVRVYIITHETLMLTNDGLRNDLLANKVDKILNANRDFGMGLGLISVKSFNNIEKHYGVELYYETIEFNNPKEIVKYKASKT